MDKIWILKEGRRKKQRIYKSEKELLKAISPDSTQEIFEYSLVSSSRSCDFFKERERDIQIRTVLGELNDNESNAVRLISYFSDNAPDGKDIKLYKGYGKYDITNDKAEKLKMLKKYQSDKTAFSNYIITHKGYFISCLTTIEWYQILLKCHRFMNCSYGSRKWEPTKRTYIVEDQSTDEMKNNFLEARKLLRKK
jgi:hypothetical protein